MKNVQFLLTCLTVYGFLKPAVSDTSILYDSKAATSDLDWTYNPPTGGWEELTGLDVDKSAIRYHQVCNYDDPPQDNWARSPYIEAKSAKRVFIDIEFSVMKCDDCRETFTLYYYSSVSDVASTTFPPWKETPYKKIDTVAAGSRFESANAGPQGINRKTLAIGPLDRAGFYIAVQDQGACMSLMSMKLYYHFCPETTHNLAYFPKTVAGGELASLIQVDGKCVSNAIYANNQVPEYWCNSKGDWKVPSGSCHCRAGYQPNSDLTECQACPSGFYKKESGNTPCTKCPSHSVFPSTASTGCSCQSGYYRANSDSIDQPCRRPAGKPTNLHYNWKEKSLHLTWSSPADSGSRNDLYYSVTCRVCDEFYQKCTNCPTSVFFAPANVRHVTSTSCTVSNLKPSSFYVFTVTSYNGILKAGPASTHIKVSTDQDLPAKITDLHPVSKDQASVTIRWSHPRKEDVLYYQVKVGSDEDKATPTVIEVSSLNASLVGLQPATKYHVQVRAHTDVGFGQYSDPIAFTTLSIPPTQDHRSADDNSFLIIIIVCCTVGVAVVVVSVLLCRWRKKKKRETSRIKSKLGDDSQLRLIGQDRLNGAVAGSNTRRTYVDYRDPHQGVREIACEIDPSKITIESVIGQGEFGEVCRGRFIEGKNSTVVAIKRLREGADLVDHSNFLREACTMAQFHDPNIVQFKGVVTKQMPAMIVTEFMENESLDHYLQLNKDQMTVLQLLEMLKGIASGMRYLSNMKYVHRDLAARNILVDSNLVCKVSDFGLSRTLENDPHATYTTQGGKIALRWTAPECIRHRKFTSASDVWSYGIVMWEVMSYGEKPYWDMSNDDVTQVLEDGYRLPAPINCPQALHNLMLCCWSYDDQRRPSFHEIVSQLDSFIHHPELLDDSVDMLDLSAPLLSPDSPTSMQDVNTLDDWLDLIKLGRYRDSFYSRGINDLHTLTRITPDDFERLGIASAEHRSRLQSGLDSLRRHFNSFRSAAATPSVVSSSQMPLEVLQSRSSSLTPISSTVTLTPNQVMRQQRIPRDVALV